MNLVIASISLGISVLLHGLLLWSFDQNSNVSVPVKNAVSSISVVMIATKKSESAESSRKSEVRQTHSSGVVEELSPELLKPLAPEYPWRSRILGEEGEVKAVFNLTKDGKPYNIRIASSSGYERLDQSALKAIASAQYNVGHEGSKEVELALDFKLRQKQ